MNFSRVRIFGGMVTCSLGLVLVAASEGRVAAQVVPGTGTRIAFDDFEDPSWSYEPNLPKASSNLDNQERAPGGVSSNNRWYESSLRGEPDLVKRVATPPGGLPGSKGSMLLRTLNSGVPGYHTYKYQQDDLIMNAGLTTGGYISPARTPSVVCRVYLPPFEQWEQRTGSQFGFRVDVVGTFHKNEGGGRFFWRRGPQASTEAFWPGFFIQFNKGDGAQTKDSATLLVRGDEYGHEIPSMQITKTGWYTLGMSFTPDGMIHYYAKPGVAPLTQADHLVSKLAYGVRVENFNTIFFNVVNQDDGRTWSTEWIVDDPEIYVLH
jgi:hypothetical protein